MKYILSSMLVTATLLSCDDNKSETCNVSDPVQELDWLRTEIENIEEGKATDPMYQYRFVAQGMHNGKTVFFQSLCCPPCNVIPIVMLRNCFGAEIGQYDTSKGKMKFQKTIWHAEGFPCEP